MSSTSIVLLPSDDADWQLYLQTCIDQDSLHYLNEKRVINWCSGAYMLYPMKTTGTVIFIEMYLTSYKTPCLKWKIAQRIL